MKMKQGLPYSSELQWSVSYYPEHFDLDLFIRFTSCVVPAAQSLL